MGLRLWALGAVLVAAAATGCGANHSSAAAGGGQRTAEENFCAQLESTEQQGGGSINEMMVEATVSGTPWVAAWSTFSDQEQVGNGAAAWPAFHAVVAPPCRSLGYSV